jgi:hypothetical protein
MGLVPIVLNNHRERVWELSIVLEKPTCTQKLKVAIAGESTTALPIFNKGANKITMYICWSKMVKVN